MAAKIHKRGGHGIEVQLYDMATTDDVFWSGGRGNNSYVLAEVADPSHTDLLLDGKPVGLYSVNGIGEIRWSCNASFHRGPDEKRAVEHFGLMVKP